MRRLVLLLGVAVLAAGIWIMIASVGAGSAPLEMAWDREEPVTTRSLHWIPDPGFRRAVADYLQSERAAVAREHAALATMTPFRKES